MVVNDNAFYQIPRGALGFFASMLAPTGRNDYIREYPALYRP